VEAGVSEMKISNYFAMMIASLASGAGCHWQKDFGDKQGGMLDFARKGKKGKQKTKPKKGRK